MSYTARQVREHLAFDVARLADGAKRLQAIDDALVALKARLEDRAGWIANEATGSESADEDSGNRIRYAQAHAVAQLSRRAALTEVLRSNRALPMIAAMAVGRWINALNGLHVSLTGERGVKLHVEAGRVACRVLRTLRRKKGLKSGVGRLTSAVVVAEFVHPDDAEWVDVEIEHGLYGARFARSINSADEALVAASAMLREAAYLLEKVASIAEPAVDALLDEAETVEADVAARLS